MERLDYLKFKEAFKGNDNMVESIRRLEEFDNYHCLIKSNIQIANSIISKYGIKMEVVV